MGTAKYVGDINNDGIADVALGAVVNDNEQHTGIFFGPLMVPIQQTKQIS